MLRDKKIIIMLGWLGMGGAERQALHVARHLAHEQSAKVEVWAFHTPGAAARVLEAEGIPWRIVPWPWPANRAARLRALWRFARTLRAARPDLILPYTMQSSFFCGLLWKWTGARACFWNQRDEGRDVHGSGLERRAIHGVTDVLSNSRHAADMLIQRFDLDAKRVRVIRNGVRPEAPAATRAQWRQRLALPEDCLAACMVANLQPFKDHTTLLHAWRMVLDSGRAAGKKAVLLLAGAFNETSRDVQQLASTLKLDQEVRFLGGVEDVSGLLSAVDMGVFSSRCEGVPNGVLECMAAGLAVAGTDIPGIREAVGPDGARFLAPPADAAALAEHILTLWRDDALRHDAGRANRRRIEREFGVERLCRETVEVLNGALSA